MSYVNALFRASQRQATRARKIERDAKRAHFDIVETLEDDFDENEVFDLSEAHQRYAIAH